MDNYTPNPSKTQPIYDPTRPFATPNACFTQETFPKEFFKKKKKIILQPNCVCSYGGYMQ